MWKHKTKWLVRGGRRVRCYLCGKKILAKGDLFLFHQDTGYYSHQSCQAESTTISGNERRKAVKKIAAGAAIATVIAAGAGKFIDISSQSRGSLNSPDTQTILTSQGLIPPALTSDPANPVPGQMWYRSDAGVMAHFDGVQNRVVYSSEINDGNVHVTSKGIINGLSVLPNDGTGWFGPDTTLGATAPGQYGSPYTETSGIAEGLTSYKNIWLLSGIFSVSTEITLPSSGNTTILGTQNTIIDLVNLPDNSTFLNCPSNSTASYLFANLIFDYGGSSNTEIVFGFNSAPITANSVFENITVQNSSSSLANLGILGGGMIYANNLTVLNAGGFTLAGDGGRFIVNNVFIQEVADSDNALAVLMSNTSTSFYDISNVYIDASGTTPVAASFIVALTSDSTAGVYTNPCNITNLTITNSSPSGHNALEIDSQSGSGVILDGITIDGLQLYNTNGVSVNGTRALVINNFYINTSSSDNGISYFSNSIGGVLNNGIFFCSSSGGAAVELLENSGLQITNISVVGDWEFGISVGSGTTKCMFDNIIFSGTFSISPFESNLLDGTSIVNNIQGFGLSIAFSTNPPASGTAYQNTNPFALRLKIPVTYSPTSSAAATLATGTSSSSTVTTSTKVSYPAGITTGIIDTYEMVVPAGQYFELVVTNATIGTVEVQAA